MMYMKQTLKKIISFHIFQDQTVGLFI